MVQYGLVISSGIADFEENDGHVMTCPFLMDRSFPGCFEYVDFTVKSGCFQGKATVAGRPCGCDAAAGGDSLSQQRKSHHLEIISLGKAWFFHIELLPSGNLYNKKLWKITIFNGKTHYKWPFSIAMLNYQRVVYPGVFLRD